MVEVICGDAQVYYNEWDAYAAEWLRNLIAAGHLPQGDVDERDIRDVQPAELAGYAQCHFFAGIGGWPLALRLAGWPDDWSVWTGSCPCQPFSSAGKRRGVDDPRHLWPVWRSLVAERRPATVFGEQVSSADGRVWLAGVRADLEALGYAVGAADLPAASVGTPHIRQRLWWVADADVAGLQGWTSGGQQPPHDPDEGTAGRLALSESQQVGAAGLAWADGDALWCRDGTYRRVEPGTFPLAHGVPGRVGRLRAYGNAICPQVAAEFVKAFMECNRG